MKSQTPTIRLIGEVSQDMRDELRGVFARSYSTFRAYRRIFDELGISKETIANDDPIALLQRMPLLEGDAFNELMDESLLVGENIIDMETSSGTTGPRKRRFISYADDQSETVFLAKLFRVCGIGANDRVACLDADPLTLMVSFTKALDVLNVAEAYAYCVGADFVKTLANLPELDPTVIISIPSILERCFESLRRHYEKAFRPSLRKIVYVGEHLSDDLRARLESSLCVEVFGYYGASETSALGIECAAHDGIHLFTDSNIIERAANDSTGSTGEIIVTTLRQQTLPLIRYALRDVISLRQGDCRCGLEFPRVDVLGRTDDSFSILGAKVYYEPILNACYNEHYGHRNMQLELSRTTRDRLRIVLPARFRGDERKLKNEIFKAQPDVDFLTGSDYLEIEFAFVDESYFKGHRKRKRIVDLR